MCRHLTLKGARNCLRHLQGTAAKAKAAARNAVVFAASGNREGVSASGMLDALEGPIRDFGDESRRLKQISANKDGLASGYGSSGGIESL